MSTLNTCTSSTRPGSPDAGDMLYETDTGDSIIWDGTAWRLYASTTSSYAIDGSRTISVRPDFHFDADKFNGVDATGNPADATTIDTSVVWTSRTGDMTAFQDTSADQPSYKTTGTNSKPYVLSTAYMYLELSEIITAPGAFTIFAISEATAAGKSALVGSGCKAGSAPQNNVQFAWASTDYSYFGTTGADSGALPIAISGGDMRAFLFIRDSSNNSRLYMDGDNTTTAVVGTNSVPQFISCIMAGVSPYGLIGNMYEVAMWKSDLSTADRNKLGAYGQAKYDSSNLAWADF